MIESVWNEVGGGVYRDMRNNVCSGWCDGFCSGLTFVAVDATVKKPLQKFIGILKKIKTFKNITFCSGYTKNRYKLMNVGGIRNIQISILYTL